MVLHVSMGKASDCRSIVDVVCEIIVGTQALRRDCWHPQSSVPNEVHI